MASFLLKKPVHVIYLSRLQIRRQRSCVAYFPKRAARGSPPPRPATPKLTPSPRLLKTAPPLRAHAPSLHSLPIMKACLIILILACFIAPTRAQPAAPAPAATLAEPSVEQRLADLESYVNNRPRATDGLATSKISGPGPGHSA